MDEAPAAEPDFTQIPLLERCVDKNWKARVSAYTDLVVKFSKTSGDDDPFFRPYLNGDLLKKWAVDTNAAAQEKGLEALGGLIKDSGENSARTRPEVLPSIVDKCFISMRAGTKAKAIEVALLYVEVENGGEGVVNDVMKGLDAKQPKLVATTVVCLRELVNNFGVKPLGDVKLLINSVIKAFNHNDKAVRSEGTLLAQALYRYLGDTLVNFLSDLKPVQLKELGEGFAALDAAGEGKGTGKATRFTRKIQRERESAGNDQAAAVQEEPEETNLADLLEAEDILPLWPANFHETIGSPKWKDKVELLAECQKILEKTPKIKDNPALGEIASALGKRMTDTNVNVVSSAAGVIAALATQIEGKGFGKHKASVVPPILDRLKEKKTADALGKALDAVFLTVNFADIRDDCVGALQNKNPMVRQGTLSFLARSLQTSRQAPTKADLDVLAPAMVGQLGDSQEPIRSAAADGVGTFLKIFGERPMNAYLENVSPPHMAKIKEASEKVTVQSKMTKAAPPAAKPQSEPAAPPKPEGPKIPARLAARFGATKTAAAEPKPDEIPEVLPEKPAPRPASVASAAASQAASAPSPDIPDESAFAPVKKPAAMPARLMARAAPAAKKPTPPAPKPAASKGVGSKPAGSSAPASFEVKYRYSPEDAEAKALEVIPSDIQAGLADSQWKERLASSERLQEWVTTGEGAAQESEILFRFMGKTPGWNEKNFQVSSKIFATMSAIASSSGSFGKSSAAQAIGPLTDKLGDLKLKKPAGDALIVFAEKTSLGFVLSQGYESMTKQKAPKAQADALTWIKQAIIDFGLRGIGLKDLINFLKVGLQSSNATVRSSATSTLVTVKLFVQADLSTFLEDLNPALVNTINGEFDKVATQAAPEPTRESADWAEIEQASGGAAGGSDALDELNPRMDLNKIVASTTVLKDAKSDSWKERKAAFEALNAELERNSRLKPEMGEIGNALRVHLDDSNLMVKLLCLQIVTKIAVGMGQPFQNHARNLATAVAAVCADQKVTTRTAALETLAVMSETCQGLDCMVPALAAAIEKPNPVLRGSVLGLIAAQFERYAPKADLTPLMPATLSSLEDRSGDVRKAAQAVLPFVVNSVGFDQVMNSVSKLKPASKSAVAPMVQAVRMSAVSTPAMSSTEPTRTAQPAETKPSLAKSVTKAAVNVPAASVPIKPEVPEVTKPRGMSMKSNALRTTSSDVAEHRLPAGASRTTIPGISAVKSRLALKRPVATTAEPARTDTTSAAPFHTSDMGPKSSREKRDLARWSYDVTNVAPQLEYLQKQMNDHASPELTGLLFSSDRFAEKDHLAGLALLDELYAADADSSPFGLTADQADTLQVANMDLVLKYVGVRLHDGSTQMILKCLDLVQRVIEIVDRGRGGFSEGESNVILPALIYRLGDNKYKDKLVAIFGLIDRTMPGSKVMQFYVEYGITSSSAKTRAAAMEQLAQLIRRRGDVVASGATAAKTYKRIAEFISSPDSATRSAALDCIAYMYHHTGDSVLTTIGELKPKERDLLKNRIDKLSSGSLAAPLKSATSSSESPRSPRHSTSQAATTPDRTSDSPSSIGSPVPQRKAGQPMLSSIPAIRQAVPRRLQSMTVDPQKEDRDDIQQSTSQQPRIKQSNHMFDTSEPSMIESSETRVGLAIKAIQSNQPDASVDALKKIQRTLMSSPGDMLRYSNALINAIATRLETIFSNATRITDPPTFRLTKHLIQTLSNFCDHSQLVETVSGDGLKDLIGQLSLGLLMTDNSDGELKDMSRFMNMSILRLFATGPRITIYDALFKLLRSLVVDFTEADSEQDLKARHAELILKCIWKRSRTAPEDFKTGVLAEQDLFTIIEEFLQVISPKEWRIRAAKRVPLGDMPLRTVKVLIQHAVTGVGRDAVFDCLQSIYGDLMESTFVYEYVFRIAAGDGTPSAAPVSAVSAQSSSESPTPSHMNGTSQDEFATKQVRPVIAPQQEEASAPAAQLHKEKPARSHLIEDDLDRDLEELIKLASRPGGSKEPTQNLAAFLKINPLKQAKFEQLLDATLGTSPFKMFIKRSVNRYLQEAQPEPAASAIKSPEKVPNKRQSLAPGPPIPANADDDTQLAMLKDKLRFFANAGASEAPDP